MFTVRCRRPVFLLQIHILTPQRLCLQSTVCFISGNRLVLGRTSGFSFSFSSFKIHCVCFTSPPKVDWSVPHAVCQESLANVKMIVSFACLPWPEIQGVNGFTERAVINVS